MANEASATPQQRAFMRPSMKSDPEPVIHCPRAGGQCVGLGTKIVLPGIGSARQNRHSILDRGMDSKMP